MISLTIQTLLTFEEIVLFVPPSLCFTFFHRPFFLLNVTPSILFNFCLIDPSHDFYSLLFLPRRPLTRCWLERNSLFSNFLFTFGSPCLCSVANWLHS